ncbi:MAG: Fe(3+)-transporting ATPase [Sediminibacterium sp.]|nr:Fe(3+)-transporting ATPase [Sediminibacterium sp.]
MLRVNCTGVTVVFYIHLLSLQFCKLFESDVPMDLLSVTGISKTESGGTILYETDLRLQPLEKLVIAGETGSGKSTLLKIIAGLVQPASGIVLFDNAKVAGPEERLIPGHPGIAYLSQDFELRNNYRMEELLAYANKLTAKEAEALYAVCRIDHLLKRKNDQVSGGEKQRLAIARLLIGSPKLLLLDEPFSNLDMIHKNILKSVIKDIGDQLKITCIMVSHDPVDTLSWADEILVMKEGRIVQQGTPVKVYKQPVNEYVAGLFGKYNLLTKEPAARLTGNQPHLTGKRLLVRPEQFRIVDDNTSGLTGVINAVSFFGAYYEAEVKLDDGSVIIRTEKATLSPGDSITISLSAEVLCYL